MKADENRPQTQSFCLTSFPAADATRSGRGTPSDHSAVPRRYILYEVRGGLAACVQARI